MLYTSDIAPATFPVTICPLFVAKSSRFSHLDDSRSAPNCALAKKVLFSAYEEFPEFPGDKILQLRCSAIAKHQKPGLKVDLSSAS
jgi:hypothetical protein